MEDKLKEVYTHSTYNTVANIDTFHSSMAFYVPATEFEQHIRESPVWKLGNVGRKMDVSVKTSANGGLGLLGRGGGGDSGSLEEDVVMSGEGGEGEGEGEVR